MAGQRLFTELKKIDDELDRQGASPALTTADRVIRHIRELNDIISDLLKAQKNILD